MYQAVNIFFSAVKLGILTWGVYVTDSLLEPASSGQSMNCSFSHFRIGFKRGSGRLPLGNYPLFVAFAPRELGTVLAPGTAFGGTSSYFRVASKTVP